MTRRKKIISSLFMAFIALVFIASGVLAQKPVPSPGDHFGFRPGQETMLFRYEDLIKYLEKLDESTDRMKMIEIGKSPMGKPMYIAFFSSPSNLENLDRLREINRQLAINPKIPEDERTVMIAEGKVFFLAALSMHSGEVGPSQSAPLIGYKIATTDDELLLQQLEDVVYMMVPCHNPDGMDLIVDNYNKNKGTKYEGSSLPRVYHKYIGHDNNRDFVILSQEDTRAISRIFSHDWFPQVMVEKHQMGSTGIRYFVPPMHDPIAENVDAELWTWTGIFGQNMIKDMTNAGLSGVGQRTIFDDYWPGSTETCIWKNVIGMLTEAASAKEATPIYIEPNELSVRGKGLSEYKKSINMPWPWPGGWWKLNDIIDYEIASTFSAIKTAHLHRKDILTFRNDICRREVAKGQTLPPFYFVFPKAQPDQSELVGLVNLMKEHGVDVFTLTSDYTLNDINLKNGDVVIPLAHPYRAFIKEVLETQEFPLRHYTPGGEIIRPYDITSWSLPLHRGIKSHEIEVRDAKFESLLSPVQDHYTLASGLPEFPVLFPVTNNGAFKAAFMATGMGISVERTTEDIELDGKKIRKGSFVLNGKSSEDLKKIMNEVGITPVTITSDAVKSERLTLPRIALIETYFHDMDAGWTRFLFDTYYINYKVLHPHEIEGADLSKNFDLVIIPGSNKDMLMTGKRQSQGSYFMGNYHPDFVKGMGKKGLSTLAAFVDQGGKVISWGASTDLFSGMLEITVGGKKEEFSLPYRNVASGIRSQGLYVPGSLARIKLKKDHLLTLGMPEEIGVFYRGTPIFSTSIPRFDMDRRTIATFPEKKILISGYMQKEELLGNRTAMIWMKKNRGQLVLFAFHPQFRTSTQASYKLLFNAMLLPDLKQ